MNKILAILTLTFAGSAFAVDYATVDIDRVRGLNGAADSTAQYVRVGKGFGDYQWGLQSRTATINGGGMLNSLEVTAANNKVTVAGVTPFVGVGHDNGFNGADNGSYTYGLVGATAGMPMGPGFMLLGAKTRVGSDEAVRTKQTVAFATYSLPVTKHVAVNLNASKSYQTIKEDSFGLGVKVSF